MNLKLYFKKRIKGITVSVSMKHCTFQGSWEYFVHDGIVIREQVHLCNECIHLLIQVRKFIVIVHGSVFHLSGSCASMIPLTKG